jgi:hypothetical protein
MYGILIAISGRRIHWRGLTVCTCATVRRTDIRATHLAEQNGTQSCDRKMWYGIIKHRNLTITQFYRHSSFRYSGHTAFRAQSCGCNMKVPIDDVLIPEQIQNPPDPRLLNDYSALCVPRMLSTVFTTGHSWTSFWARWNQSTPHIWGTTSFRANRRLKVVSGFSLQGFF